MRKKLQDLMFETSYLFELFISFIVGLAIVFFGIWFIINSVNVAVSNHETSFLIKILDDAIILAIGAELIKMLCKHTPETIIEVLAFALARHLIIVETTAVENIITVLAIAVLFGVRKFLLKSQDMVETPDGLVKLSKKNEKNL